MTLYKLSNIEHETVIIRYHFHPIKCISDVCYNKYLASNAVTNYFLVSVLCQAFTKN